MSDKDPAKFDTISEKFRQNFKDAAEPTEIGNVPAPPTDWTP